MRLKVTVLGCGGSMGVPSPGFGWGDCDPHEPKNVRTRVSILIEQNDFRLLVDTGPDLRQQLLRHDINDIDAVICTHAHSDHVAGLDDVRPMMVANQHDIPFYATAETMSEIMRRFHYLFAPDDAPAATRRRYDLKACEINLNEVLPIPMPISVFDQWHGNAKALGIRVGAFAYSTDVHKLDDVALEKLKGIDTWIVDCNNRTMADSYKHADLNQVVEWNEKVGARQVYLTHLPSWHDYKKLETQCPEGIEPAYDGLIIRI